MKAKKTTFQHVRCNRRVDLHAKKSALEDAAVDIKHKHWLLASIAGRQKWLVDLNKHYGDDVNVFKANGEEHNRPGQTIGLRATFPRWLWNANPAQYTASGISLKVAPPNKWKWSDESWFTLLKFASALKWQVKEGSEVAFVEL